MLRIAVYLLLVAVLFAAAGFVVEQICARARVARRGVWLAALVASIALPAYWALATSNSAPSIDRSAPVATRAVSNDAPTSTEDVSQRAVDTSRKFTLPDWRRWPLFGNWYTLAWLDSPALDKPLAVVWIASSSLAALVYALAWLALRRAARRWRKARLDGGDVLISSRLGPAMFGLVRPRIVLPRWLLDAPGDLRSMVLRHEREHVAGRDQLLLTAGLALAALAPWNLALWWQLRRLRLAIETDCDARVVRGGADAAAYAKVLLEVRQRRVAVPLAAVALTEPVSDLERRIGLILQAPRRMSRLAAAGAALVAATLIVAACAITPPAPPAGSARTAGERQSVTGMSAGERVVILVDVSASMLTKTLPTVDAARNPGSAPLGTNAKWRQLTKTVQGLTARVSPSAQFQVIAFNGTARSLFSGRDGQWLAADRGNVDQALRALTNETGPAGPKNLGAALAAAAALLPQPDTVYVVTDGLPDVGASGRAADSQDARVQLFREAAARAPAGVPVNVILLPLEGEEVAAPAYWTLALSTGGALLAPAEDASDSGVPLDSEYLIFVIDTSGSMRQFAWQNVGARVAETIAAYPSVKGLQVLSDEGQYLLPASSRGWIPDTPETRAQILGALADWSTYSASTPGAGILAAIDSVADKNVAVYVYGDDLAQGTVSDVLTSISGRNLDATGNRKVRINSVAFPTIYDATGQLYSSAGYASLMRELSQQNGGSFIGLPAHAPR
ncbi:MAG TPA: M56 family metallopeptidase [Gammaproteobacteria bacterium]|nr:M56 family metallopeptidase [Gammaproteobacteria bacterium]